MAGNSPFVPIFMAVRSAHDVREMSFQTVVDKILKPAGLKMGGFPEDIFIDLTEEEQKLFMCNICYLIANDIRVCDNRHVFCRSCSLAWSMTYGENANKCPFCRCDQPDYVVDKDLESRLSDKRVRCRAEGCSFKSPLRIFLVHSHGKTQYSNADVDFARLHAEQSQLAVPPPFALADDDGSGGRAAGIREQLLQGRMMIHQMMLLMHLEMQLRQQALTSYQEANDPEQRLQRLDDVMALNEQLNEVGGILSTLLSAPLARGGAVQHLATTGPQMPDSGITVRGNGRFLGRRGSRLVAQRESDVDEDDNEINYDNLFDDDSSDDGGLVSDDNSDAFHFESFDDDLVQSRVLNRNEQSQGILASRSQSGPDNAERETSRQSLDTALSAINVEMQQEAPQMAMLDDSQPRLAFTRQTPISLQSNHTTTDHHMLPRRQELQSPSLVVHTPVDVHTNELHAIPNQPSAQSQVTLPRIAHQSDLPSPAARGHSRNENARASMRLSELVDGVASNQSNAVAPRSSFDSTARTRTIARLRDQPSARELSRSSASARQSLVSAVAEPPNGPVTEPWPAVMSRSNVTDLPPASIQLHSSSNRGRGSGSGAGNRIRIPGVSQATSTIRHVALNALPVRRTGTQLVAGRRPQVDQSPSILQRRTSNWPVVRSLSRDAAQGRDAARPPIVGTATRTPATARTPMMPLPNPARGARVDGLTGPRTSNNALRPRRRSEIVHELMFPRAQREN